jgi:hypothetical protein
MVVEELREHISKNYIIIFILDISIDFDMVEDNKQYVHTLMETL